VTKIKNVKNVLHQWKGEGRGSRKFVLCRRKKKENSARMVTTVHKADFIINVIE